MVGVDFENRNSIIYLTPSEFMKEYTHDETTGLTVASSPARTSLTGLTLTAPFALNAETNNPVAASSNPKANPEAEAEAEAKVASPEAEAEAEAEAKVASPAAAAEEAAIFELIKIANGVNLQFGIAHYNTKFTDGWRHATMEEWKTDSFQAALILAHIKDKGWAILETSLNCNNSLYVHEGEVKINDSFVVEVGFDGTQQLRGVYSAMNFTKGGKPWTEMLPKLNDIWSVDEMKNITTDPPCLFVKDSIQNNSLEEQSLENAAAFESTSATAAASIIQPVSLSNEQQRIAAISENVEFAIGYHSSNKYPGWTEVKSEVPGILNKIKTYYLINRRFIHLGNIKYTDNKLYIYDRSIGINKNEKDREYIMRNKTEKNEYIIDKTLMPYIEENWFISNPVNPNTLIGKPCLFMRIPKK
jgi:hypothetical protein